MSISIVVSQSMYFPWVGLLEQVRLADRFVHYDDIQFDRGFYNRVQIKTQGGPRWLTVPLSNHRRGQKIDEITVDDSSNWRKRHRALLVEAYCHAPFVKEMMALVDGVFERSAGTLGDISRASFMALVEYFDLRKSRTFTDVRELNVGGASSQRLCDITLMLKGDTYVTGHGARNYLDHDLFERSGIGVKYMRYNCTPYTQLHGAFTPYVTALDLVANCGKAGAAFISSGTVDWRQFLDGSS